MVSPLFRQQRCLLHGCFTSLNTLSKQVNKRFVFEKEAIVMTIKTSASRRRAFVAARTLMASLVFAWVAGYAKAANPGAADSN